MDKEEVSTESEAPRIVEDAKPVEVKQFKRPRSEKQINATNNMKKARMESINKVSSFTKADRDLMLADYECTKERKRKERREDWDNLITKKLDDYHGRLMDELHKPLSSYFDNLLENETVDEEERKPEPPRIDPVPEPEKPKPEKPKEDRQRDIPVRSEGWRRFF